MCGKQVNLIIFIASIYLLGVVDGYVRENSEDENTIVNDDYLVYPPGREFQKNGELSQFDRTYMNKRSPGFTPYISVGALSNMHQFFKNLKDNFRSLENLSDDQARALLGDYRQAGECDPRKWKSSSSSSHPRARKHSYNKGLRVFRPPATAAYLHAIRNRRPNHKIRNFVSNSEPPLLRGSNNYNPSYLWTGLGRRR